jgi:hypothetical protein
MREELVIDALRMAVKRRRPDPGVIHHSDQGGQYVSLWFGLACTRAGISRSMGSVGDCYDNAVAETFFATLKKELVYRRSWPTRQELCSEVFEYIEGFYNPRRRALDARDALPGRVRGAGRPRARARARAKKRQRHVENSSSFQHQRRLLQRQRLGARDLLPGLALRRAQHDPRSLDQPYLRARGAHDPLQLKPILRRDLDPPASTLDRDRRPPSSPIGTARTSRPTIEHPHDHSFDSELAG